MRGYWGFTSYWKPKSFSWQGQHVYGGCALFFAFEDYLVDYGYLSCIPGPKRGIAEDVLKKIM